MLPVWIYALTAIAASGGYGLKLVYKTAHSRAGLAASVHSTPALAFLYGQLHGDSLGALIAWRYLAYAALGAGLMSIFLVVRHTRADEETGRLELVGSTAVGRHTGLCVAMLVASAANLILFVLSAAVLTVSGLPLTGAIAFGLAEAGCGLAFAARCGGGGASQRYRTGRQGHRDRGARIQLPAAWRGRLRWQPRPEVAHLAVAHRLGGAGQAVRGRAVVGTCAAAARRPWPGSGSPSCSPPAVTRGPGWCSPGPDPRPRGGCCPARPA